MDHLALEMISEAHEGRRRRRYYRLTNEGRARSQDVLAKQSPALRLLVPGWNAT